MKGLDRGNGWEDRVLVRGNSSVIQKTRGNTEHHDASEILKLVHSGSGSRALGIQL